MGHLLLNRSATLQLLQHYLHDLQPVYMQAWQQQQQQQQVKGRGELQVPREAPLWRCFAKLLQPWLQQGGRQS
jgi:hypothetical protein